MEEMARKKIKEVLQKVQKLNEPGKTVESIFSKSSIPAQHKKNVLNYKTVAVRILRIRISKHHFFIIWR